MGPKEDFLYIANFFFNSLKISLSNLPGTGEDQRDLEKITATIPSQKGENNPLHNYVNKYS